MRHPGNQRLGVGIGAAAGALVLTLSGFAVPAFAVQVNQTSGVSPIAVSGTPALPITAGTPYEAVRELQECNGVMYAVGQFTTITQGGVTYTRDNVFSFSATAPYAITSWAPDVNGIVDTIAFDGTNCSDAYIGGNFTSVNGTPASDIAEIDTASGNVTGFLHSANGEVYTIAVANDTGGTTHVLAGGAFTSINGSPTKYYASLNPSTGQNDNYINDNISGTYKYPGVAYQTTKIYNQQVSHGGARVMVEGVFTSVKGQPRQQVFQEWLGPQAASVTGWTAPELNDHCIAAEPFYVRAAAWAPNDSTVYLAATGDHLTGNPVHFPLTGPCDATTAFASTESSQNPVWTNYTGCDSLYAAAADDYAVYVAGHPRWANNPNDCNAQGTGAVPDRGLQGLSPGSGQVETDSQGTAGLYQMSRSNADDEIITSAGLWIASTNRYDSGMCGGVQGVSGICFLPYTS